MKYLLWFNLFLRKILILIPSLCFFVMVADAQIADSLDQKATQLFYKGDYSSSLYYMKLARKESEKENGYLSVRHSIILTDLAIPYKFLGFYDSAIVIANQALAIRGEILGRKNLSYAETNYLISDIYRYSGNYREALNYCEIAIGIRREILGENHIDYARAIYLAADLELNLGDYKNAEILYNKAIERYSKANGYDSLELATIIGGIAKFYQTIGRNKEAENNYIRQLSIQKRLEESQSIDFGTSLSDFGELYRVMGRYKESEDLLLTAKDIYIKKFGLNHFFTAAVLNNLGNLYLNLNRLEDARDNYLQCVDIIQKIKMESNPIVFTVLSNLANVENSLGEHDIALKLYERYIYLKEALSRKDDLGYAILLGNMAIAFSEISEFEKAESILKKSIQITQKIEGGQSYYNAMSLCNLAYINGEMGKAKEAKIYYNEGINQLLKYTDEDSRDLNSVLENLSVFFVKEGKMKESFLIDTRVFNSILHNVQEAEKYLNESEFDFFLRSYNPIFNYIYSNAIKYKPEIGLAYNLSLISKGIQLENNIGLQKKILQYGDSSLKNDLNELLFLKQGVAHEYSLPLAKRNSEITSYSVRANELQKNIVRKAGMIQEIGGGNFGLASKIEWKDIKGKIRNDEASIEFIRFHFRDNKKWTDSLFYCAYILRYGDTMPKQIFLFEQKQLDIIVNYTVNDASAKVSRLYEWNNSGDKLYKLIWSKIEPEMKGVKTIYFSPSGGLYKISFPAIPNSDSTVLSDKYHLVQLNSTREIALESFNPVYLNDTSSIALFGGINYDMDTSDLKKATARYHKEENEQPIAFASRSYVPDSSSRGRLWRYLPGTLNEVEFIKPLFKQSTLFTGAQATEEAFKSLQGKKAPDILHMATHGFFFKSGEIKKDRDGKIREFEYSNDPMIRSGLMLAGSNLKWNGEDIPSKLEDGILTAKEVAALNLYNTKLVVLSACETGLGDIKGSEGVYGLQRAFKAAGVNYLFMSLWTVPDEATAEFMKVFYTKLKQGFDIQTSFEQTQATMKLQYRNEPYKWAGFVLVR